MEKSFSADERREGVRRLAGMLWHLVAPEVQSSFAELQMPEEHLTRSLSAWDPDNNRMLVIAFLELLFHKDTLPQLAELLLEAASFRLCKLGKPVSRRDLETALSKLIHTDLPIVVLKQEEPCKV